jgi:hypothetical protein
LPVQRSVTVKSSYMIVSSLVQPRRMGKAFVGAHSLDWDTQAMANAWPTKSALQLSD